jgi:hypothetical protein
LIRFLAAVGLLVEGLNVLGDGLRGAIDPKRPISASRR